MEKMKRIAAFLMVLVILGLVVWAFILGITGSEYFQRHYFCAFWSRYYFMESV